MKVKNNEILFNLFSSGFQQSRQHWRGLVCRKIKLKNFYDPKTAGGCGVVRFWSVHHLFGYAVTRQRPAVRMIFFKDGIYCLIWLNAPERRWLYVMISACEDKRRDIPAR
ncbi:hypothetical protein RVY14_001905 [Enterobacter cloacae]|nr:hypothetical protein [Enterobacter cloacae]